MEQADTDTTDFAGDPVVDVHAHVVPRGLIDRIRSNQAKLPSVISGEAEGRVLLGLPRPGGLGEARPVLPALLDVAGAATRMSEQGIDLSLVSIWPDLIGVALPPEESSVWARCVNDSLIEVVQAEPRFEGLAVAPAQAPDPAAELSRAMDQGFVGVEIGTTAYGEELDSPKLAEFWSAADELQTVIFLHPMYMGGDPRLQDGLAYGLANSIGRVNDTTVAVAHLLLAGIPERHPGARIIVAHGGGTIPYLVGRLLNVHEIHPDETANPVESFKRLSFDSLVFAAETLRYMVEVAGPNNVLLGSDHPFANGDPNVRRLVESALEDESVRELVLRGNAKRLLSRSLRAGESDA